MIYCIIFRNNYIINIYFPGKACSAVNKTYPTFLYITHHSRYFIISDTLSWFKYVFIGRWRECLQIIGSRVILHSLLRFCFSSSHRRTSVVVRVLYLSVIVGILPYNFLFVTWSFHDLFSAASGMRI